MQSAIYEGQVLHYRFRPKKHKLSYRVFSFLIDLDELAALDEECAVFAHNRPGIFAFYDKDHGDGRPAGLRDWVDETLTHAGIACMGGSVRLLCYPRLLGYAFNPLSVYYCHDQEGVLTAMIYEVHNTFGQTHSYVLPVAETAAAHVNHHCDKKLYVSPFMEMDCRYHFTLIPPGENILVNIDQTGQDDSLVLKAVFNGTRQAFTNSNLFHLLWRYPLMTMKVTIGIHWEALKLWRKGLGLVPRPAPPVHPVTAICLPDTETNQ